MNVEALIQYAAEHAGEDAERSPDESQAERAWRQLGALQGATKSLLLNLYRVASDDPLAERALREGLATLRRISAPDDHGCVQLEWQLRRVESDISHARNGRAAAQRGDMMHVAQEVHTGRYRTTPAKELREVLVSGDLHAAQVSAVAGLVSSDDLADRVAGFAAAGVEVCGDCELPVGIGRGCACVASEKGAVA